MPPERISTVARRIARKTHSFDWSFGSVIEERPKLGILVMRVIECWSITENRITGMLAHFLKLDFVAAFNMLHAINSPKAKIDVIKAVARSALSADDYDLFSAVIKRTTGILSRRNEFCHWIWASSSALPDDLLLLDPEGLQASEAKFLEMSTAQRTPGEAHGASGGWDEGYVFTEKDLQEALSDARWVDSHVSALSQLVRDPVGERGDSLRSQLRRDPLIAQTLHSQFTQKNPQAQP